MASEKCAGCFGTGKYNGSTCSFCSGTGNIWVPDKTNYSTNVGYGKNSSSNGPSWLDNAFEDNLAQLTFLGVFGFIIYKGFESTETNWYITITIGLIAGFIAYKLLKGPLRPLGTLLKYVFYIGLIGLAIYGIYQVVVLF